MKEASDPLYTICRLCLTSKGKLLDMFKKTTLEIPQRILACTNISVQPGDGFPHVTCAACLRKLNKAHKFLCTCLRSARILRERCSPTPGAPVKLEICDPGYEDNDEKWSLSDDECIGNYSSRHTKEEADCEAKIENVVVTSLDDMENEIKQEVVDPRLNQVATTYNSVLSPSTDFLDVSDPIKKDCEEEEIKKDDGDFSEALQDRVKKRSQRAVPAECPFCLRGYKSAEYLMNHVQRHHSEEEYEEFLKNHIFQERPHICSTCGKGFLQKCNLKVHRRTHSEERPFKCSLCLRAYKEAGHLSVHMRSHSGVRPHACPASDCSRTFRSLGALRYHQRSHDPAATPAVTSDNLPCSLCRKSFPDQDGLTRHMETHSSTKEFFCEYCAKSFSCKSYLRNHRLTHMDGAPKVKRIRNRPKAVPERCPVCQLLYRSAEYLLLHMKARHSGPAYQEYLDTHELKARPFICSECGKGFSQQCSLTSHERTHRQERPHECPLCHKRFGQSSNLKTHMRCHSDLRMYRCSLCPKAFRVPHHLKFHLKIHTDTRDHVCPHCNKGFRKNDQMREHMRTHTGEKPYSCEICGKTYSTSSTLRTHRSIHSGQQPHVCKFCQRAFNQKSSMLRHLHTHRNDPQGKVKRRNKIYSSDNEEKSTEHNESNSV